MKRILLIALVAMFGLNAWASDDTGKALTVRSAVKSFLQTEGYAPKIDSDNDLAFKYQGSNYYISFENWNNQVYVNVFSQLTTEGASVARLRVAADEAQRDYKFVRINVNKTNVSIIISLSVQSSSELTRNLLKYLDIVSEAKAECKELYNAND